MFDASENARLFSKIAVAMHGVPDFIVERQLGQFEEVHPDYAAGVRAALHSTNGKLTESPAMGTLGA